MNTSIEMQDLSEQDLTAIDGGNFYSEWGGSYLAVVGLACGGPVGWGIGVAGVAVWAVGKIME